MQRRILTVLLLVVLLAPSIPSAAAVGDILPPSPRVDFDVSPEPRSHTDLTFTANVSSDVPVLLFDWTFEDVNGTSTASGRSVVRAFDHLGAIDITLTVTDALARRSSVEKTIWIEDTPPVAVLEALAHPAERDVPGWFYSASTDLDDEPLQATWRFDDGGTAEGDLVRHAFTTLGSHAVELTVTDPEGASSTASQLVQIVNAAPRMTDVGAAGSFLVGASLTFHASATDPDAAPDAQPLVYEWRFDDGFVFHGQSVTRTYDAEGNRSLAVRAIDEEGAASEPLVWTFAIAQNASNVPPEARFTSSPSVPRLHQRVDFADASSDADGYVVNWTWDLGDGTIAWGRYPHHVYDTPGSYVVTLTVRDFAGASGNVSHVLDVVDRAPVAMWTFSTPSGGLVRGEPAIFEDASTDPDGDALVASTWDFGDGSPVASAFNVTHTYERSGFFTVDHSVRDAYDATGSSRLLVRVAPTHDVLVHVHATLPGGRPADLSASSFSIVARLLATGMAIPSSANGTGIDIMIPRDMWVDGDGVGIRIDAPFVTGGNDASAILRDGSPEISMELALREPVVAAVKVAASASGATFRGAPVFDGLGDAPHGGGRLRWADGAPAVAGDLTVEVRYVGLVLDEPVIDTPTPLTPTVAPFIGWCAVDDARTDGAGAFAWRFDGQSACGANALGVQQPGRWEVRVRARSEGTDAVSPARAFYVDPTGGIAMNALLGFA